MRTFTGLTCFVLAIVAGQSLAAPAPEKPKANKPAEALDKDLLKQLGDDPLADDLKPADLKPADAKPTDKPGTAKPAAKPAADDSLEKQLLDGLLEGEDIGAPNDPLARIGKQMRQAGGLIGQSKSGGQTQELQKRIVTDLDQLIREARKQQQQQQSSSSTKQQKSGREQVKQAKPGMAQSKPSDEPARDSSEKLGKNDVRKPDMGQMNDLIKDIWGQLPERQREQMMQSSIDQFLPKYELLIEEYFKALVERQQAGSSR
jgi:hypothetical protein